MKLRLIKKLSVGGSVKYDPVKFREYRNKTAPALQSKDMGVIVQEIMRDGFSIIPTRDREKIRGRAKRDGYRWRFTSISLSQIKVTPYKD